MRNHPRTRGQNEVLVCHILDALAAGKHIKQVGADFQIPHHTLTNMFSRYKKRHGFNTTYQMLAVYLIVKERKRAKSSSSKSRSTSAEK